MSFRASTSARKTSSIFPHLAPITAMALACAAILSAIASTTVEVTKRSMPMPARNWIIGRIRWAARWIQGPLGKTSLRAALISLRCLSTNASTSARPRSRSPYPASHAQPFPAGSRKRAGSSGGPRAAIAACTSASFRPGAFLLGMPSPAAPLPRTISPCAWLLRPRWGTGHWLGAWSMPSACRPSTQKKLRV